MQYIVMEKKKKNVKHMKNKGMNSPFEKNYHCWWLGSIANLIYCKGSKSITNTFFLLKQINYLRQSICSSQIQTQLEKLKIIIVMDKCHHKCEN